MISDYVSQKNCCTYLNGMSWLNYCFKMCSIQQLASVLILPFFCTHCAEHSEHLPGGAVA